MKLAYLEGSGESLGHLMRADQMNNYASNHNLSESSTKSLSQNESKLQIETAQYIAEMILELRNLSKARTFSTLQGLLEISYYEAFSVANRIRIPENEDAFLRELGSDARKFAAVA